MDAQQRKALLETQRRKLEAQLQQDLEDIKNKQKVQLTFDKFISSKEDKMNKLAADTVGLVHLEQFQRIKESTLSGGNDKPNATSPELFAEQERKIKARKAQLSFDFDDEEVDDDGAPKRIKIVADPNVANKDVDKAAL